VLTDVYKRFLAGEEVEIWPSRGSNAVPIAFNPATNLVYATTWNIPRLQKLEPPAKPVALGDRSTGVAARIPAQKPGDVLGYFLAMDPITGKKKWEIPLQLPSSAGVLATGGGLLFTGLPTGELVALDEATGKTLWQFKTGSSVNSTAITYMHKGRQYVTIASGRGGGLANRYAADIIPAGGAVWTFAVME
jgi:alcohol dehydrogenase (cytochrome c)